MFFRTSALLLTLLLCGQLAGDVSGVHASSSTTERVRLVEAKGRVPSKNLSAEQLSWSNVVDRIADVSAASWIDAQYAIARNRTLPNAGDHYVSRITAGARAVDPLIDEVDVIMKRLFSLTARVPYPSHVFFIALTGEERVATKRWLKNTYPGTDFVAVKIDEMYGVNSSLPAGNPWTAYECNGSDYARNGHAFYQGRAASALILGLCPAEHGSDPHFEGSQGMAHEYVHTLSRALNPGIPDADQYLPCWFTEGEPEWAQTTTAVDFDTYLRAQHLHPYYLTQSGLQYQQTEERVWTKSEVEQYLRSASVRSTCANTKQYALAYSLGAAAVEVIASISGSQSIFRFHKYLARKTGFKQSFQKAFGISWARALPTLAEAVAIKITRSWGSDALTYQTRPVQ